METTLAVGGMHCRSCSMLIDEELADLDGVAEVRTSLERSETKVVYDAARVDVATLLATIEQLGYQATERAQGS